MVEVGVSRCQVKVAKRKCVAVHEPNRVAISTNSSIRTASGNLGAEDIIMRPQHCDLLNKCKHREMETERDFDKQMSISLATSNKGRDTKVSEVVCSQLQ